MAPLGAAGRRAGRGAAAVGDRASRSPIRRSASGRGEVRAGPQVRRGARHPHYHSAAHDHATVDLCLMDRVLHSPNHHYYYHHHHDTAGGDHDEPMAGRLRVRGRPVGQRRMHDHNNNHNHHHDRTASASAASAAADSTSHDDSAANSAAADSTSHDDSAAGSDDDDDRAAVLGHQRRIQRHAQGSREGNLRILHRAYLRSSGGAD